ncbi:MAG: TetR/AcrR family transcriptional regulator [Alphaproteobacteria bacterium]
MSKLPPQNTKDKILCHASTLFAEYGYSGASIRAIAENASVNIASINYHFGNKKNLYYAVFKRSREIIDSQIDNINSKDLDLKAFGYRLYKLFIENGPSILNTFKMILTTDPEFIDDIDGLETPPAWEILLEKINTDAHKELSVSQKNWLAYIIFQRIFFVSLMDCTTLTKNKIENFKDRTALHDREEDIHMFIDVILKGSLS